MDSDYNKIYDAFEILLKNKVIEDLSCDIIGQEHDIVIYAYKTVEEGKPSVPTFTVMFDSKGNLKGERKR